MSVTSHTVSSEPVVTLMIRVLKVSVIRPSSRPGPARGRCERPASPPGREAGVAVLRQAVSVDRTGRLRQAVPAYRTGRLRPSRLVVRRGRRVPDRPAPPEPPRRATRQA
ncbi:hypothetical protein GCM10009730_25980 [Streptomyces albidochromogenes]